MKKIAVGASLFIMFFCFLDVCFAADRAAIEKAVSSVVMSGIFNDKSCMDRAPEGLYIFIMKEDGELLVHPKKDTIKTLNSPEYKVIFDQLIKATEKGTWVQYQWAGAEKNTFVQRKKDKIIGCGY